MKTNQNFCDREKKTVQVMIAMYCRHHHPEYDRSHKKRCDQCAALYRYAESRIENCIYGLDKPVCSSCTIHCYKDTMREHIRKVMRYSGPRMIYSHPILAVFYLIAKRKSKKR